MKQYGSNPNPRCPLYSECVADFAGLEKVTLPSPHTVLLIAADARGIPADVIARVAGRLLASGLTWICAWGPDCERVHDIFDEVHVGDGLPEPPFTFMSTWHSDEPLDEALWFFIQWALPLDSEIETTSYLAVTVGRADWAASVDHAFSDLTSFKSRMLGNEDESTRDT